MRLMVYMMILVLMAIPAMASGNSYSWVRPAYLMNWSNVTTSVNVTGDTRYWMLDGSNAPPTGDWDMAGQGFDNVGTVHFADGSVSGINITSTGGATPTMEFNCGITGCHIKGEGESNTLIMGVGTGSNIPFLQAGDSDTVLITDNMNSSENATADYFCDWTGTCYTITDLYGGGSGIKNDSDARLSDLNMSGDIHFEKPEVGDVKLWARKGGDFDGNEIKFFSNITGLELGNIYYETDTVETQFDGLFVNSSSGLHLMAGTGFLIQFGGDVAMDDYLIVEGGADINANMDIDGEVDIYNGVTTNPALTVRVPTTPLGDNILELNRGSDVAMYVTTQGEIHSDADTLVMRDAGMAPCGWYKLYFPPPPLFQSVTMNFPQASTNLTGKTLNENITGAWHFNTELSTYGLTSYGDVNTTTNLYSKGYNITDHIENHPASGNASWNQENATTYADERYAYKNETKAYISVRTRIDSSNIIVAQYNKVFNMSLYASNFYTNITPGVNIEFDSANGTFIPLVDGIYDIECSHVFQLGTNTHCYHVINVNGQVIRGYDGYLHASVDPMHYNVRILYPLSAGDRVSCEAYPWANTATVEVGTAFNMNKEYDI